MNLTSIISLGIIVMLGIIVYQDLSFRRLDVRIALTLLLLCCLYNYYNPYVNYLQSLQVVAFICVNIIFLSIYFSIKKKRSFNPIDSKIGLGDIVFLLVVSPLFLLRQFIIFFVSGLLFSILLTLLVQKITKQNKSIPLAGYLSIYLISIFAINFLFKKSFLNLGSV